MNLEQIHKVGIVGAGTMGAGIGLCFALAGYEVNLFGRTKIGLERARDRIEHSLALFEQEELLLSEGGNATKKCISYTTGLETCLSGVQFVIESVSEQLFIKQELFRKMEELCLDDTILATNTSGLSITSIASACRNPERVVGMHWANPAEIVPLVEVIRGEQTTQKTVDLTYKLTGKIGKMPVKICKEIPGFASNRLQFALFREALYLIEAGIVSPQDVDKVLKGGVGFRYPWLGPLETADLGGLDVFCSISEYLFQSLSNIEKSPSFFSQIVAENKLGIKSGEGFYKYQEGDKERILRQRDLYFVRQLKLIREIQQKKR